MPFVDRLPHWVTALFRIALLGEIYPDIRAIAVGYSEDGDVLIRYYLDREPTDFDRESIEIVATNFDALGGKEQRINKIDVQCIHAVEAKRYLDPLTGFIYSKREDFS
ncbi:MAG: colicin [Methylobacterium sp.]|uniref:colicin n=1 Tax=Methylobacterium sp. TaxID=409 RepID=UPI0027203889|nr:colicin [Methylobacterium sp.]MDO9426996.1 colicin [Methylobacterium sp.]